MFSLFYPSEYYSSTYAIDFKSYYDLGYRGLIFDIDNTLVPHGAPSDERSRQLIKALVDMGFDIVLLSNNKKARVELFLEKGIRVKYIAKANKPLKKSYLTAMEAMHTGTDNTIFIGDQLFTDVYGAKACKMKSILVKPINPKEEIQIVLKRKLEKIILKEYLKKNRIIK